MNNEAVAMLDALWGKGSGDKVVENALGARPVNKVSVASVV